MPKRKAPRKGSLQYWPRKRAKKYLPRVNWKSIKEKSNSEGITGLKGFIGYKAGMKTIKAKDNTPNSLTKEKEISIPVTILECPPLKILSVRFYKNSKVAKELIYKGIEKDKELKRKIKIPKPDKKEDISKVLENISEEDLENYDDISIIAYTKTNKTNIKKTPEVSEIGIGSSKSDKKESLQEKINFVKENLEKEISIDSVFSRSEMVDIRGLTKGKGLQGPVKRFGIKLKDHKSEKGRRRPGSLAPWHPARVTFKAAQAGQLGMFTRLVCNNKIIDMGNAETDERKEVIETLKNLKHYGDVKTSYIAVRGSVQGPKKRQLIITHAMRPTKRQNKKEFEVISYR